MKNSQIMTAAVACAILGLLPCAFAVDPLYQWNFNSGDGANTGTGSGGTLLANVGPAATTPPKDWVDGDFDHVGVTGVAGDNSYEGWNSNDSWWGNFYSDAAGIGNVDLTGLTKFTITMWINRDGGNNCDVLNIGSTTTPGQTSNPGINIRLYGNWDNGINVGVNGYGAGVSDPWGAGYNTEWVFLAFVYDSTAGVWWAPDMNTLYGAHANGAALTGGTATSVSVAANLNMHIGDWGTAPGLPSVGATATAFLGNNGPGTAGFSGQLDDVRIYNSLLTVAEIEAIRLEALNQAPVAGSSFEMGAVIGTPTTVQIIGGKWSPTDADNDPLTITSVTTDGTNVTYTATAGTTDSFTYTVSDGNGGTASANVSVTISAPSQGYNQLDAQMVSGNARLTYLGIPGSKYALDWTHSLSAPVTWEPLVTNTAAGNGYLLFTNTPSGGSDFYRTRYVP
jgi:hypothetical protein